MSMRPPSYAVATTFGEKTPGDRLVRVRGRLVSKTAVIYSVEEPGDRLVRVGDRPVVFP